MDDPVEDAWDNVTPEQWAYVLTLQRRAADAERERDEALHLVADAKADVGRDVMRVVRRVAAPACRHFACWAEYYELVADMRAALKEITDEQGEKERGSEGEGRTDCRRDSSGRAGPHSGLSAGHEPAHLQPDEREGEA